MCTCADEYYMVRDDVWPLAPDGGSSASAASRRGSAGGSCRATSLDAPVNRPGSNTSARLADRLGFARASLFEEAPAG